jgi:hypothetical protein
MATAPVLTHRPSALVAVFSAALVCLHLAALRDAGILAAGAALQLALAPNDWLTSALFGSSAATAVFVLVCVIDALHVAEVAYVLHATAAAAATGVAVSGAVRAAYVLGTAGAGVGQVVPLNAALADCARQIAAQGGKAH